MGNSASCTPYVCASGGAVRVIDADGRAEEYAQLVRAAEIMVENPGHFVCDSRHLCVGCRIPGLTADEELERDRLYFLLPMDMLYSVLTEEEEADLTCKASGAMSRRPGGRRSKNAGRRILPVLIGDVFCLFPPESKQAKEPAGDIARTSEVVRLSRQRSWKPALDTIEEVT